MLLRYVRKNKKKINKNKKELMIINMHTNMYSIINNYFLKITF